MGARGGARKQWGLWATGLGLLLLGAAACSTGAGTGSNGVAPPPAPAAAPKADGPVAADFTFPLYTGQDVFDGAETLTLSDLRGKAVVLNFWAPLCPPCRAEMPDFQELWDEVKDQGQVVIVGVDVGPFTGLGDRAAAVRFLDEIQVTYPTGQAQSADIVVDYAVQGMPTTVFIRADGTVMRKWTGALNKSKLEEITQQLLQ